MAASASDATCAGSPGVATPVVAVLGDQPVDADHGSPRGSARRPVRDALSASQRSSATCLTVALVGNGTSVNARSSHDQGAALGAALDVVPGGCCDGVLDPRALAEEIGAVVLVEVREQERRIFGQPPGEPLEPRAVLSLGRRRIALGFVAQLVELRRRERGGTGRAASSARRRWSIVNSASSSCCRAPGVALARA